MIPEAIFIVLIQNTSLGGPRNHILRIHPLRVDVVLSDCHAVLLKSCE